MSIYINFASALKRGCQHPSHKFEIFWQVARNSISLLLSYDLFNDMCVRCAILHYAEPFDAMLHRLCVGCATRRYPEPFNATLHRLSTVLQMSAKLFVIELVHFTISCSNSTWATRPFLIWLNYSCLGCSVSLRKTRLSIIWPCHSFISYAILQLILKPSMYLLIYLTSLYFWWWRPLMTELNNLYR